MINAKNPKEPVGGSKPRSDQNYGRVGGAATVVFDCGKEGAQGAASAKISACCAVDFSAAVLLQYASKPLK